MKGPAQHFAWRSFYPVHPCADVFPMMSDEELDALAEDIKARGLNEPVVLWSHASKDGTRHEYQVLDGRNRLEALVRLGVTLPSNPQASTCAVVPGLGMPTLVFTFYFGDPAAYVISANIRRRHFTKEQQAELIVKTIEAGHATTIDSTRSARSTPARTFNPNGTRGGSTRDPMLAIGVIEAAKHGISKGTVQHARAKMQGKPSKTLQKPTVPTPALPPLTLTEHLRALLTELRAKRKSNRDERARRQWDPTNILFQTETLNWVEQTIARLVGEPDPQW